MKQSTFHKTGYGLLAGMMLALAPVAATYAQGFSADQPTSDEQLSNQPSTTPDNAPAETMEAAPPSSYPETREAPPPRGARGPMRSDMPKTTGTKSNISVDNLRATDKYVVGLPDFQYRLSSVFKSD